MSQAESKNMRDHLTPEIIKWLNLFAEGIVVMDSDCTVLFANKAYYRRTKLAPEQFIGMNIAKERSWAVAPEVIRSKRPQYGVLHMIKDQESFTDVVPFLIDGEVIGVISIVRHSALMDEFYQKISTYKQQINQLNDRLRDMFRGSFSFEDIVGNDREYVQLAFTASQSDSSVLITGESGTGKEVIAQAIHNASPRRSLPFVDINCAALPEQLLESELFGYAPGAFTGASKSGKIGLFEIANGGTMFLDEISEMPLALQSKLLRVLQERKIRRVGGTKNIPIDVRIIAATNRNPQACIDNGTFRSDLFYRLAVFIIDIPPLRERREDIHALAQHFIREDRRKLYDPTEISDEALHMLESYDWPGNIRQLKNAIEYANDVATNASIRPEDLPAYIFEYNTSLQRKNVQAEHIGIRADASLKTILEQVEKAALEQRLDQYPHDLEGRRRMADSLGVSVATLYTRLRKYGLIKQ